MSQEAAGTWPSSFASEAYRENACDFLAALHEDDGEAEKAKEMQRMVESYRSWAAKSPSKTCLGCVSCIKKVPCGFTSSLAGFICVVGAFVPKGGGACMLVSRGFWRVYEVGNLDWVPRAFCISLWRCHKVRCFFVEQVGGLISGIQVQGF